MNNQAEALISLTYVSSAAPGFKEEELVNILRSARRNNERLGVTGMLLYRDGNFMQTLEGTDESIAGLIEVIEKDPRHRGIIRLLKKAVSERSFGSWSMAFQNLSLMTPEDLTTFNPFLSCYKLMLAFKGNIR